MPVDLHGGRPVLSTGIQPLSMRSALMKPSQRMSVMVILGLLLAGCYEPATIEFHEPGVYKGKTDPLLSRSGTPELETQLQERLTKIQTDR
jgi:hypothetical protein